MNDALEKFYEEKGLNGQYFFRQTMLNLKEEKNIKTISD